MFISVSMKREKNTWSWGSVSSDQLLFSSSWYILAISWRFFSMGGSKGGGSTYLESPPMDPGKALHWCIQCHVPSALICTQYTRVGKALSNSSEFHISESKDQLLLSTGPLEQLHQLETLDTHEARILGSKMLVSVIWIGLFVVCFPTNQNQWKNKICVCCM